MKISNYSATEGTDASDVLIGNHGGNTRKFDLSTLKTYFAGGGSAAIFTVHNGAGGTAASLQDGIWQAMIQGYDVQSATTDGQNIDFKVVCGNIIALGFFLNSSSGSAVSAVTATHTVTTGKVADLLEVQFNYQSVFDPSYQTTRLRNITTGTTVCYPGYTPSLGGVQTFGYLKWGNLSDSPVGLFQLGVAGDVLTAQANTAGDGHIRNMSGLYIFGER